LDPVRSDERYGPFPDSVLEDIKKRGRPGPRKTQKQHFGAFAPLPPFFRPETIHDHIVHHPGKRLTKGM
jgi:hypothetical protein